MAAARFLFVGNTRPLDKSAMRQSHPNRTIGNRFRHARYGPLLVFEAAYFVVAPPGVAEPSDMAVRLLFPYVLE